MEEHDVKTVLIEERAAFKGRRVRYDACYMYCDVADELYMNEQQIRENDMRLKDAYRVQEGLMTSTEIASMRAEYGITQGDLCVLLGWGGKTITRYESHQVQDKAHDTILKKLADDPEWFLSLLEGHKDAFPEHIYQKYQTTANALYAAEQDRYLRRAILARYAGYDGDAALHGNTELSLDKVVDMIRYFAAAKTVKSLYKVKLMKLMWYADALSFKKRGTAITGLVYQALPMGAVPVGHNAIISLKGVPCREVEVNESTGFFFSLEKESEYPSLSREEKAILDAVIQRFGAMPKDEIVTVMHKERAYTDTPLRSEISFEYANDLKM